MLRLLYEAKPAGAPDQYGEAADSLVDVNGKSLQSFPKIDRAFIKPAQSLTDALKNWLAGRAVSAGPIVLLVHGYMFDPSTEMDMSPDSPYSSIYGMPPAVDTRLSWLPLAGECDPVGRSPSDTVIAFAYKSMAGAGEFGRAAWANSYQYAVFDQAPLAARAVAAILSALGSLPAARDVRILAHSLGTRTVTQAIRLLGDNVPVCLKRIVLLDGAEFSVDASQAYTTNHSFDVINISNREDTVLTLGAEKMCHPVRFNGTRAACVVGRDGLGRRARWLDLQLDAGPLAQWLQKEELAGPLCCNIECEARPSDPHPVADMNHWVCYTDDGNRTLVRRLLLGDRSIAELRAAGIPEGTSSPMYGLFDNEAIPVTPMNFKDRRAMLEDTGAPLS